MKWIKTSEQKPPEYVTVLGEFIGDYGKYVAVGNLDEDGNFYHWCEQGLGLGLPKYWCAITEPGGQS